VEAMDPKVDGDNIECLLSWPKEEMVNIDIDRFGYFL
jgi:hypothetical protein